MGSVTPDPYAYIRNPRLPFCQTDGAALTYHGKKPDCIVAYALATTIPSGRTWRKSMLDNTPATRLSGLTLENGWIVGDILAVGRAQEGDEGSGGTFSVSYLVTKEGKTAFLKAFDLDNVLKKRGNRSWMETLQQETTAFNNEKGLNTFCVSSRMRQVVKIIEHGDVTVPSVQGDMVNEIPYMVLELADGGDVRSYLKQSSLHDLSIKFRYLKEIVLGIAQLHAEKISHQDIKPSNVMIFEAAGAKIGDLGRASVQGIVGVYDGWVIAGDHGYAPPEQLYGLTLNEWVDRRERCDLYQFGSLISFLMFGVTVNTILQTRLSKDIAPRRWGDGQSTYSQALPYLQKAFYEGLEEYKHSLPNWLGNRVVDLIDQCSNPDYTKRGARSVMGKKNFLGLGLNRFVSELDFLCNEADRQSIIAAKRQA
jgi:eukaryotic-like serine/threonine-protein kinase